MKNLPPPRHSPRRPTWLPGIALFAALASGLLAQGRATPDWSRTLTLLGANLYGAMIARGADDSIYVTGHYPNYRIVTAKFAADGTPLWQRDFANVGTREHAAWLTVDAFGDVVIAGYTVTGGSMTPSGFVTLKYDASGTLLWSRIVPGTWSSLSRVATDANGDVVVIGRTLSSAVVAKYSRSGTPLWTRFPVANAFNQSEVGQLAIDPTGTIYLTGGVLGTMETIAYDAAGTLLWSRSTPAMGTGWDLALSAAGEVYVAGTASGTSPNRSLVAKYDALGTPIWIRTYPGTGTRRLAIDEHDDVVILSARSLNGGYMDWLTQKLDSAGNVQWSAIYDQHRFNDEVPYALEVGPDDEIYVTGQGGPGPASGTLSYLQTVTVRYAKTGAQEWAATSFASLRGLGVVRLADNSIATVGESTFTIFHHEQSAVWRTMHGELAGATGAPHLEGTGSPRSAAPVAVHVGNAAPNAFAWLVVGLSRIDLPIFGGVLVPAPDVFLGAFVTDPAGSFSVPFSWPHGVPAGLELTFQAVVGDASGPFGFTASNALVGVSL